ncbi:MAG: metallophosphoesterase family protein [Chloroflexota bacterium]
MMKLAVISDIHGNLHALDAVLNDLETVEADKTWVLGDLAAHGPRPAECVTKIRELAAADRENFKVIGGNTDRWIVTNERSSFRGSAKDKETYHTYVNQFKFEGALYPWATEKLGWENYEYLSKLIGRELRTTAEDYGIVMGYHAIPGNDEYNITDDTPDEEALDSVLDRPLRMGIYGHIHRQVNRDLRRAHLVNPGSVGMSFETPGKAQYAVITFEGNTAHIDMRAVDYDIDAVAADLEQVGHPHPAVIETILREGRI